MIFIPTRVVLSLSFSPLEDGSARIVPWQQDFSISFTEATKKKKKDPTVPKKHFVLKAIIFTKCQFDSPLLICFMWNNRPFYNLQDLFFHVATKEMLSVVWKREKKSRKGKCWRTSWIGRHTGVITLHTGKLWWFNSHANYLNQCAKCHCFFKEAAHAPYAGTRAHVYTHTPTPAVNRNCTPTITTFLHLTQLHVSRIIRQRLDNPDRNPFSFPQPPCKFSFCNIIFSRYPDNQRPFKDLKFLDSEIRPVGFTFELFFLFFCFLGTLFYTSQI